MPHYKSPDNQIHFLDDEAHEYLLPAGSVKITDEEAEALRPQPAPVIPSIVSMRQARLALLQSGLLSTVNAAIAAGGPADQITWEYATEVRREDALVSNMAAALNLTPQDLDNLFALAATL